MVEQQLQPGLPIPLSCILHNSLFVKSQRSGHTPEKEKEGTKRIIYMDVITEQGVTNGNSPITVAFRVCSLYMHLQGGSLSWCHLPGRKTLNQSQNGLHSLDGILLCIQSSLQCSRLVAQRHNYIFFMLQSSGRLQEVVIRWQKRKHVSTWYRKK